MKKDDILLLQWGPVVVTGIRRWKALTAFAVPTPLQWGPVVVTGIRRRVESWAG